MTTVSGALVKDANGSPVPQYYNVQNSEFEPTQGSGGSPNVQTTAVVPSAVVTLQNGATVTGNGTALSTTGMGVATIGVQIVSGTATISWLGVGPDGNTYALNAKQVAAATGTAPSGLVAFSASASGVYEINCRGMASVYASISAISGATVTAKGWAQALTASDQLSQITGSNATIGRVGVQSPGVVMIDQGTSTIPTSATSIQTGVIPQPTILYNNYALLCTNVGGVTVDFYTISNFITGWQGGQFIVDTGLSPSASYEGAVFIPTNTDINIFCGGSGAQISFNLSAAPTSAQTIDWALVGW